MTTVSSTSALDQYRGDTTAVPKGSDELGQKAFLKLMITQLEHQDPLSPQDNTQFIAQLAQFSSVESLDRLNNNFDTFTQSFSSGNALQAATLIGRSASVKSEVGALTQAGPMNIAADLPVPAQNMKLTISNAAGEPLRQIALGSHSAGELNLNWTGSALSVNGKSLENVGESLPAGSYTFKLTGEVAGETEQFETFIASKIESVGIAGNGTLTLNVAGQGVKSLADIKAVYQ